MGTSEVDLNDYFVDLCTFGTACIKIECKEMTKQEQIAQLKQTIQDAKEQVERLEKGRPKWVVGNVVRIFCGIRLVTCLGPGDFTLISLDGYSYCRRYPTLVDLECAICEHQDTEVLANTVAEYYAKR